MSKVFIALFVNDIEGLKKRFIPLHKNLYYHHSTILYNPLSFTTSDKPIGEEFDLKIIGRFTNDKVDALLVDNKFSSNKFPHITLSTAEGVEAVESNYEIENNQDKIRYFKGLIKKTKPSIKTTYGYYTPVGVIKKKYGHEI